MSCRVCYAVAIPGRDICPECLVELADVPEPEEFSEVSFENLPDECVLHERPMSDEVV